MLLRLRSAHHAMIRETHVLKGFLDLQVLISGPLLVRFPLTAAINLACKFIYGVLKLMSDQ